MRQSLNTPQIWNDQSNRIPVRAVPPGLAFALLGTVQATLILAITVVAIPLPAIQQSFGVSRGSLALVSQAYGLSFSGLLLLGARAADRLGPRRALRLGVAVFGLASVGAAVAPDLGTLIAARCLQGCGAALAAPAAMALLPAVFPSQARRARATAVWGTLAVTGANAGTLLSGVLLTVVSWRWTFVIPAAVAAAASLSAPRLLPTGPPANRQRLDVPGALLATAGMTGLSYGLISSGDHAWTSAVVLVPLLAGGLAMAAFAAVESHARAPLLPPGLLSTRRVRPALSVILLAAAASAGTTFVLSLYFQQVRGYTPLHASAAFAPFLLVIVSGQLSGRLLARLRPVTITTWGLGLTAAGLLLAGQIGTATPYAGALLAGLLLIPMGLGLAFSGATVTAATSMPASQAALGSGLVNAAMEAGPNLGVAAMVAIAGARSLQLTRTGLAGPAATASGYALALTAAGITFAILAAVAAVALYTTNRGGQQ